MKILVKFPTRSRPELFLAALTKAIKFQQTKNVTYLVSYDEDDKSMTNELIEVVSYEYPFVKFVKGSSKSKIHACNRDLNEFNEHWDILVLLSDDMICNKVGWDSYLIKEMREHYSDTDGVLFHSDGYVNRKLNTMCILGRKYYERFNYIYHPSYKSFWCDNEFTDVANKLNKQTYFPMVLFKHEHPANNSKIVCDELYTKNNTVFKEDMLNYQNRRVNGFT